jgi:Fungal specific transcription factor domain
MSTGRKCDFQSLVSQALEETMKDQSSHSTNLKINQLSIVSLDALDSSYFDYFINVCSKEFSLYFESPVWESIILQAASTEPCIRHAALAIGAMSRNNYHSQSSELALEYSMKQYNLALRALNDALDDSARSWELAILGSIVFIAFEVLWGVDTRARMHLDGAFAMLGSLPEIGLGSTTDLGYLVSALSRLGGQISSFGTLYSRNWSGEGSMGDGMAT